MRSWLGIAPSSNMFDEAFIAQRRVVRLTTVGRKTGLPRTVKVWFVVTGPREIAVQHVRGPNVHWYRNLEKNPAVRVDFGEGEVRGQATVVRNPEEIQQILRAVRRKYGLVAWLLQMFGTKNAVAAKIELLP